jgi:hypothetical protein
MADKQTKFSEFNGGGSPSNLRVLISLSSLRTSVSVVRSYRIKHLIVCSWYLAFVLSNLCYLWKMARCKIKS